MATYYVDTAVGNDSNAGTSEGAGNAWATLAKAETVVAAGDLVHVKASGTYTITAAITLGASGTEGVPITWEGYTTTPGDGGRATVTTATNSIKLILLNSKSQRMFKNFVFSTTAGTRSHGFMADTSGSSNIAIINCVLDGFTYGIYGGNISDDWAIDPIILIDIEIKNCTSCGARLFHTTGRSIFRRCYVHDNTGATTDGFALNPSGGTVTNMVNCVFARNGRHGVFFTPGNDVGTATLVGNIFIDNASSGIYFPTLPGFNRFPHLVNENNIYWSNGGYGHERQSSTYWAEASNRNNAYGDNTSGARLNLAAGTNDVALTGDPFVDAANGNFALNNTAGAGAACRAAGFPGVAVFGTGYADIGALQHQDAGGGGAVYHGGMMGGLN